MAHLAFVGKRRKSIPLALSTGEAAEKGGHLLPCHRAFRMEQARFIPLGNAIFLGPGAGGGIPGVLCHIGEGSARHPRASGQAVKHRHRHGPGDRLLGEEGLSVPFQQALGSAPGHIFIIPGLFGHIGKGGSGGERTVRAGKLRLPGGRQLGLSGGQDIQEGILPGPLLVPLCFQQAFFLPGEGQALSQGQIPEKSQLFVLLESGRKRGFAGKTQIGALGVQGLFPQR